MTLPLANDALATRRKVPHQVDRRSPMGSPPGGEGQVSSSCCMRPSTLQGHIPGTGRYSNTSMNDPPGALKWGCPSSSFFTASGVSASSTE